MIASSSCAVAVLLVSCSERPEPGGRECLCGLLIMGTLVIQGKWYERVGAKESMLAVE